MSRRLVSLLGAVGLAAGAFAVAPAVLAGDPCFHQFDNRPAPNSGASSQVILGDCVFTPTVNSVPVGTTVTWFNASMQEHEVLGSNMTWGAHEKLLSPGDSIGWTFDEAGVFAYSCMLHPGMTGTIVVGRAVADLPDGAAPVAGTEDAEDPADSDSGATTAAVGVAAGAGGVGIGLALAALLRRRRESVAS